MTNQARVRVLDTTFFPPLDGNKFPEEGFNNLRDAFAWIADDLSGAGSGGRYEIATAGNESNIQINARHVNLSQFSQFAI